MATTRTTYATTGTSSRARVTEEILLVTRNVPGIYSRITNPLASHNINIECFTSYTWGDEVAFRIVTDNNPKARDIFMAAGFYVQVYPVTLWYTENTPGTLDRATVALENAKISTYSSYMTTNPVSDTTTVTFNTNDITRTVNILNQLY